MNIPEKIFKSYDIRAIYPDEINEENISGIVRAIYKFFLDKSQKASVQVALGYDMRLSSPSLFEKALNTLLDCGASVIDVGLISTPTFYFSVFHNHYEAGIQITASHNPKEYNGLKMVMNSPKGLIKIGKPTGMEDIKKMATSGIGATNASTRGSVVKKTGSSEEEVDNALKILGNPSLKNFKIVADPANAMGITYLNALFKKVPATLIRMNFELDGNFPAHQPDPLQAETLVDLQKRVVDEKADLGLAPDGDGDRLFFIDEKGLVVPPSIITGIVAKEMLKTHPGEKILFDIRYILTPGKIVEESGGTYEVTKVGHAFITEQMHKTGAIFAGESSGHYFFRETGNAESQLPIILTILKVLSEEDKTFSEVIEEYRRSFESGEINFKISNAPEVLETLKNKYNDGELSALDGIAVTYSNWRFNVRTSNTEPLLRFNLESYDKSIMEQKRDEIVTLIKSIAK